VRAVLPILRAAQMPSPEQPAAQQAQ
jgi:hypothetical protein